MHIEPGVVTGAKLALSFATAAGVGAFWLKTTLDELKYRPLASLAARAGLASGLVFTFFQVLPHFPVGVSEVHFILGSTLFLLLGAAPAAFGLAVGLLLQGIFFAPTDLPQYAMNLTTLLAPLFALSALARRVIPAATPYVDLEYRQALALSLTYQGGVVAWVAFWALYGHGFGAENIAAITSFGAAYMMVVLIEPLADLAVLAAAKSLRGLRSSPLVTSRLFHAA